MALLAVADPATLPRLYVDCGAQGDRLLEPNERFAARAGERGADLIQDVVPWLMTGR